MTPFPSAQKFLTKSPANLLLHLLISLFHVDMKVHQWIHYDHLSKPVRVGFGAPVDFRPRSSSSRNDGLRSPHVSHQNDELLGWWSTKFHSIEMNIRGDRFPFFPWTLRWQSKLDPCGWFVENDQHILDNPLTIRLIRPSRLQNYKVIDQFFLHIVLWTPSSMLRLENWILWL
jgi:hypothetical protein